MSLHRGRDTACIRRIRNAAAAAIPQQICEDTAVSSFRYAGQQGGIPFWGQGRRTLFGFRRSGCGCCFVGASIRGKVRQLSVAAVLGQIRCHVRPQRVSEQLCFSMGLPPDAGDLVGKGVCISFAYADISVGVGGFY